MPINTIPFVKEDNPLEQIQNVYKKIDNYDIDAIFKYTKKDIKKISTPVQDITRSYIEMIIEDFALLTQNQALYNKFLQIDTKLEKSLREYQAEIKGILNSVVGINGATSINQLQNPVLVPQVPQAQPINAPTSEAPIKPERPESIGIE